MSASPSYGLNAVSNEFAQPFLDYTTVDSMYGEDDLASCSLFAGNLINFGFYESYNPLVEMTYEERVESERNLYRRVLSPLNIRSQDRVLEVGCGLGCGGQITLEEFAPAELVGLDLSPDQIRRAKRVNSEFLLTHPNYIFQVGNAQSMPFTDSAFEKIYSVEAIQHFPQYEEFLKEAHRVLKPEGKLCFAAFFATKREALDDLKTRIDTYAKGIDIITPIKEIEQTLSDLGFRNIKVESIGKNVWEGFDHWIKQTEYKNTWDENWLISYKDKLVDYYVISADK